MFGHEFQALTQPQHESSPVSYFTGKRRCFTSVQWCLTPVHVWRSVLSQEGDEILPKLMRGTRHFPDKLRIPTSCFYTSSGVPLNESKKKRKTHLHHVQRERKHDFVVHFLKKSWSTFYLWCFHLVHILKERLNIGFTLPYCKVISTFWVFCNCPVVQSGQTVASWQKEHRSLLTCPIVLPIVLPCEW